MEKLNRLRAAARRVALAYFAALSVPVLLSGASAGAGNLPEAFWPWAAVWEKLAAAWLLTAAYFCVLLAADPVFRESLLARLAGFRERDEREELVTARAARAVFLVTLGTLLAGGLAGSVRMNYFARVPPRGAGEARLFVSWPSLGLPGSRPARPEITERLSAGALLYRERGGPLAPELARILFALAAVQVLLFHFFSRRGAGG